MNSIIENVTAILKKVRLEGDRALQFYQRKFDGIDLPARRLEVDKKRIAKAFQIIDPSVRSALLLASRRIEAFHKKELSLIRRHWSFNLSGIKVGQQSYAMDSVGIYVPGGRYCYPSTVLMTAIPAKAAGVREVVMVTPAKNLKNEVLAAAYIAKVDRIFAVGGPAAIGALAFGTETIPKVQKIVGPGNQYVTEAKRQVYGVVGIDGLAGPSEVAIWIDESADPAKAAANLMAQAEHDPESRAFLFSLSLKVLGEVRKRVEKKFIGQTRFVLKKSRQAVVGAINEAAPEHLILAIRNPSRALRDFKTAGAIFLGDDSPVPLGDYAAGPSHVLPTGRAGRFGSGLCVKDFLRWSSTIETIGDGARSAFKAARRIAEVEGLEHHARALMNEPVKK